MVSFVQALKAVNKALKTIKKQDPTMPTPYILLEMANTIKLEKWEGYDATKPYLANLRSLIDRINQGGWVLDVIRGDEDSKPEPDSIDYSDLSANINWEDGREVERVIPNIVKKQKLKRKLKKDRV